jgi:hypothetical protein
MGGQNQQEDQDAINKQADPNSEAMSLDKDSCRCDKRVLQPQKVYVHQPHSILLPPGLPEGLEEVIEGLEEAVETAE